MSPTVALVGTTASGKSAVAMAVATQRPGTEIVCVDSMTVYRGMDVGTAKPSPADRAAVPHHLLDLVDPGEEFTVAQFQSRARAALDTIASRGHRALLVGGTGLYLRAVVDDLELPGRYPGVAAALEQEADRPGGLEHLYARLGAVDPLAASRTTATNRRRILRALEVTIGAGRPFSSFGPGLTAYPPTDVALVGLPFAPDVVDRRIEARFRHWVDAGLVDEVRRLAALPGGLSRSARQALGYKELLAHVIDGAPLGACMDEAIRRTRTFARRQMSWFRRDPRIRWASSQEDAVRIVAALLDEPPDAGPGALEGRRPGLGGARSAARSPRSGRENVGMVHAEASHADGAVDRSSIVDRRLVLGKYEAAGNDFLVVVDADATWVPTSGFARSVCDRHRGVGADGLLVARPGGAGADLQMLLYNADGSRAEMSGNGIRCLVQAAVAAGLAQPGTLRIRTDAGIRQVEHEAGSGVASVEMGAVDLGGELESPLPGARACRASVGNPHVVVVMGAGAPTATGVGAAVAPSGVSLSDIDLGGVDLSDIDLGGVAARVTALVGEPVNVEVVRATGADTLALRVFERGVGETAACGTGSCAAAGVARAFGLVGDVVTVENPGGALTVHLGSAPGAPVFLRGPVRHVADVVLAPTALDAGTLA